MEEMVYRPTVCIVYEFQLKSDKLKKKKNFPILCPLGPEMTSRHHFLTKPNWITKKDPYFYFLTTQPAPPQKQGTLIGNQCAFFPRLGWKLQLSHFLAF